MEFSLFYFSNEARAAPGSSIYRLLIEGARFADENGLVAVWTPERHFHAFGGAYPNPAVTSTMVAAVTSRVGVRAGSVVAPLHHPVRIAEDWSMVDNLSGGRVGVSFASGWNARDFVFTPGTYPERRQATADALDTVRRLWRGEDVELPDGNGDLTTVHLHPAPIQPELPVWISSAGSPETFVAAGSVRANVLTHLFEQDVDALTANIAAYRSAWEAAPGGGSGHVTLAMHTFLGEDVESVRATVRDPLTGYLRSAIDLIVRSEEGLRPEDVTDEMAEFFVGRAFERYFDHIGLFGPPERCFETVERLEEIGVQEIACFVDFGVDDDSVLASLGHLPNLVARFSA